MDFFITVLLKFNSVNLFIYSQLYADFMLFNVYHFMMFIYKIFAELLSTILKVLLKYMYM